MTTATKIYASEFDADTARRIDQEIARVAPTSQIVAIDKDGLLAIADTDSWLANAELLLETLEGYSDAHFEDLDDPDGEWYQFWHSAGLDHRVLRSPIDDIEGAFDEMGETGDWKVLGSNFHFQREEDSDWRYVCPASFELANSVAAQYGMEK